MNSVRPKRRRAVAAAVGAASLALLAAAPIAGHVGDVARAPGDEASAHAMLDPWGALTGTAGARLTQADLLSAPVPSLCGHPAGRLVEGLLPGLAAGVVWVFTDSSGAIPPGRVAYGALGEDLSSGAAVAVYCDQGGVGWPEAVVLYRPGPTYLGHVVLSELAPGRQQVEEITLSRGVVTVRFTDTYAAGESGSRGRRDGIVELRVVNGEIVVAEPEFVDERATAEEAVRAAVAGDGAALAALATSDAATELLRLAGEARAANTLEKLRVGACMAPLLGAPDGTRATCLLDGAHLHLSRVGFATWQLTAVTAPLPG